MKPSEYLQEAHDAYQLARNGSQTPDSRRELYARAQAAASIASMMMTIPMAHWPEECLS